MVIFQQFAASDRPAGASARGSALGSRHRRLFPTLGKRPAPPGAPGFAAPYALPARTETGITTHADRLPGLLEDQDTDTAAQKTAKAALRTRFTQFEIAADFVTRLRADRDAIDDANEHNRNEVNEGVENTAAIGVLLTEINGEIEFLQTIMRNKYERQPEKLRAWESASRVERAPVKAKKDKPANGTTPVAPTPTSAPVLQPA